MLKITKKILESFVTTCTGFFRPFGSGERSGENVFDPYFWMNTFLTPIFWPLRDPPGLQKQPVSECFPDTCKSLFPPSQVLAQTATQDPLLGLAMELEQVALKDEYFVRKKLYPDQGFFMDLFNSFFATSPISVIIIPIFCGEIEPR